jgi:hypothetical protein
MASLMDIIRNNSNQSLSGQLQPQVGDETQKAATLLRAKSGKAVGGGAVAQSNIGEQTAADQTASTMQNSIAPAAALQQTQVGQQESAQQQQSQLQQADIAQTNKFATEQTKQKTAEILNGLSQGNRQIDLNRDKASLEQVGVNLRLSNQKYTDDLQREGDRARLDNANNFSQEYARTVLNDTGDLASRGRINASALAADDRTFRTAMAGMDIQGAYNMFRTESAAESNRALWTSGAATASAGVGAYNTYDAAEDRKATAAAAKSKE